MYLRPKLREYAVMVQQCNPGSGEKVLSWSEFLQQLRCFLNYPEDRLICFISDRQKDVIGALKMHWPETSIRWGNDIPLAVNKKIKDDSVEWIILRTLHLGKLKYEMLGLNRAYTTNLNDKAYNFGVNGNQSSLEEFIDPALSKSAYLRTYIYLIHPIPDVCVWDDHEEAPIEPSPLKNKTRKAKIAKEGGIN
ncbi:hypothetical protein Ddye_021003 [Dipteronia dyeriana]|uniref:Uncharacterized protein n=1 Tax=Dipteronia dyeriana TaxID=168575 RepID=A0AAD9U190_9ROSI|nr:hypothetical protein Ddye_021003 [Dipteronia dyeriana]